MAQEKSSSTGTVTSRSALPPHRKALSSEKNCFREGYGNFQTLKESWNCSTKGCECTRLIKTCFSDGTERVDEKTSNFGVDEDSSETGVFVESALKARSLLPKGVDWDCRYFHKISILSLSTFLNLSQVSNFLNLCQLFYKRI